MRRAAAVTGTTLVAGSLLLACARWLGPGSVGFAFVAAWAPMTWMGVVSRSVRPRLPASWHVLRPFEQDGRVYEHLGVRVAKRVLRRGPLAAFNPHLHLPAAPDAGSLARLEQRMCDAEAAHALMAVVTLGYAGWAGARGWWWAALWALAFDVLMNGYPVMLQRYNRAVLHRRFGPVVSGPG